jgi:hypothetical protein
MQTGVILTCKVGHFIPPQLLEKLTKEYNSCFGIAFPDPEGDKVVVDAAMDSTTPEKIAELRTMDAFEDKHMTFFLGKGEFHGDDISPITLVVNDAGDPVLVALIEGDFPGYAKQDSTHSNAFWVAEEYLATKFQKMYHKMGKNIDAVMEDIKDDFTRKEMENLFATGGGSILLIASNGKMEEFEKDRTSAEMFDWGFCSNTHGFKEVGYPEKEEPKAEPAKKPSMADLMRSKSAKPTTEDRKPPENNLAFEGTLGAKDNKTSTAVTSGTVDTQTMFQCPKTIKNRNEIKTAYHQGAGYCPKDYMQYPVVPVAKGHKPSQKFADGLTLKQFASQDKKTPTPPTDGTGELKKDTATKHIVPATPAEVKKVSEGGPFPIITPEQKEDVTNNFMLKEESVFTSLDTGSQVIMTPDKVQVLEHQYPPMHTQLGIDNLTRITFSYENWIKLCKNFPEVAAGLACDFRLAYFKLLCARPAVIQTASKTTTEEKASASEDVTPTKRRKFV